MISAGDKPAPPPSQLPEVGAVKPETESMQQMSRPDVVRTFSRDEPIQMPEKVPKYVKFSVMCHNCFLQRNRKIWT